MAVDDDPAAVGEVDLQDLVTDSFEVEIDSDAFKGSFDPGQDCLGVGVEIVLFHVCYHCPILPWRIMYSFLAPLTLALILLTGCGNRGGLVLPPKPQAVPVAAAPATPPSVPEAERVVADNPARPDSSTAAAEAER